MSEWISVKDRLPEDERDITLFSKSIGVINGYYWMMKDHKDCGFYSYSGECYDGQKFDITHWMPKPNPPEV